MLPGFIVIRIDSFLDGFIPKSLPEFINCIEQLLFLEKRIIEKGKLLNFSR